MWTKGQTANRKSDVFKNTQAHVEKAVVLRE